MTKKISILLILLIISCFAKHSWAYEAVVLKSADIEPYNEALKGFQSACGCSVTTLTINKEAKGGIEDAVYRRHPDVVIAIGMDALTRVTTIKDLPVVYVMVPGPLYGSTVAGNVSGVGMNVSPSRYLDTIKKLFPRARKIGLVYDQKESDAYVKEAMRSAAARGIELVARAVSTAGAVPSVVDSMKDRIDIFWMLPETSLLNPATVDYMLLFSFENKVPILTFSKKYVEMGAAAALTVDSFGMGAQAGTIAKKLQDSGVVQIRLNANVSGVVINRKVLDKLGVDLNDKTTGWTKDVD